MFCYMSLDDTFEVKLFFEVPKSLRDSKSLHFRFFHERVQLSLAYSIMLRRASYLILKSNL